MKTKNSKYNFCQHTWLSDVLSFVTYVSITHLCMSINLQINNYTRLFNWPWCSKKSLFLALKKKNYSVKKSALESQISFPVNPLSDPFCLRERAPWSRGCSKLRLQLSILIQNDNRLNCLLNTEFAVKYLFIFDFWRKLLQMRDKQFI